MGAENNRFRTLCVIAALMIIVAGMRVAAAIVTPIFIAIFLSMILLPVLRWLQSKRLGKSMAMVALILSLVGAGVFLTAVVKVAVHRIVAQMPDYRGNFEARKTMWAERFSEWGIDVGGVKGAEHFDPQQLMEILPMFIEGIGDLFGNLLLVLFLVIFLLWEWDDTLGRLKTLKPKLSTQIDDIQKSVLRYMFLRSMIGLVQAVAVVVLMLIVGIPFPGFWGFLAFMCNYIPEIGDVLIAASVALFSFVQHGALVGLGVGLGVAAVTTVIDNILTPRLLGKHLNLSMVVVFLSIIFWGWVLGPVGLFLAVPLTTTMKFILDGDEDTRWIGAMIGEV